MHGLRMACCCLCCTYFEVCNEVSWHSFKAASPSVPRRGLRCSCWTGWPAEEHTGGRHKFTQGSEAGRSEEGLKRLAGAWGQPSALPLSWQEGCGCLSGARGVSPELGAARGAGPQAAWCAGCGVPAGPSLGVLLSLAVLRLEDLPRHH